MWLVYEEDASFGLFLLLEIMIGMQLISLGLFHLNATSNKFDQMFMFIPLDQLLYLYTDVFQLLPTLKPKLFCKYPFPCL